MRIMGDKKEKKGDLKGASAAFKYYEREVLASEDTPNYDEMQEIEQKLSAHRWDLE